jgi:hypothetical protein
MAVTFKVDDVTTASAVPSTRTLREHLGKVMAFGGDGERRVLADLAANTHPLLGAVHVAFAEHRPLVLSPDIVWLTILAGVTQHVRLNAERLRPRLVRHAEQKRLTVVLDTSLREHPEAIRQAIPKFRELLEQEIGQGTAALLTCDFSTTTDVERMASEIILMDTFSPYFEYDMQCVCGIPELTLLGEADDWQQIRERIDIVAEFDLGWWTASLAPILDEFVRAAQGSPKVSFFRDIYQPREAYGGDTTVGWAARLYPYLSSFDGAHRYDVRNPLLEKPVGWRQKPNRASIEGIRPDRVPTALGACRILVDDQAQNAKYAVRIQGGLAAIEVDDCGRLIPLACWSVVEDRGTIRSVIESIRERADARYLPPEPPLASEQADHALRQFDDQELDELRDAFGELRLFEASGEWRLRPPSAQVLIQLPKQKYQLSRAKCVLDLPDGSLVALAGDVVPGELFAGVRGPSTWRLCVVRLREEDVEPISTGPNIDHVTGRELPVLGPTQTPHFRTRLKRSEIPIVANSLTELFERALACDGKLELEPIGFLTNDD